MCKKNIDPLPLICPQRRTWPATQACALTRNRTGDLSICRTARSPLSHTSQNFLVLLATNQVHPHFRACTLATCTLWGVLPTNTHTTCCLIFLKSLLKYFLLSESSLTTLSKITHPTILSTLYST